MFPILTPAESAAIDRTCAERGIPVEVLMENAGRGVARTAAAVAGGSYGRRAAVVCGKGNNGGDGLVAARYLARWGMAPTVLLIPEPGELTGAAGANLARFALSGGRWRPCTPATLARETGRADVVVDAIFGTGFRGEPDGPFAEAIAGVNEAAGPVVAADIPSGVDGETGAARGPAVWADVTVALGALKPGVVFHPGAEHAGTVEVADIGIPDDLVASDLWMVQGEDAGSLVPVRAADGHKRDAVVIVVAGSRAMTGAPVLAARAAYRAGAGLVTLAVPEGILPVVQDAVAEATYLPLPQTDEGSIDETAWPIVQERLGRAHALAVGPGLSTHPSTERFVRKVVAESSLPVVLDADGLNAFAGRTGLLAERASDALLTPHAGEFGRLTGLTAPEVLQDRVGHARKAAAEFRCPVLLKGSRTLVAEPEGRVRVNPTGGPVLATAGTGDVLTGAITAFIARGLSAADAAVLGAYIHGLAGDLRGARTGPGTVASDVADGLAVALEAIGGDPA